MQQLIRKLQTKKGSNYFRALFWFYTVFLLVITLLPGQIIQSESEGWLKSFNFKNGDKVIHFALFFIFTILIYLSGVLKKGNLIWIVPISVGIFIEILQHLMAMGRTFDFYDILANSTGILIAYFLFVKKL